MEGGESDMRLLYCAAYVCPILGDWEDMDKELAFNYILSIFSYDL